MKLEYLPAQACDIDALFAFCKELIDTYEDTADIQYEKVLDWVRRKIETRIGEYTCVYADGQKAAYISAYPVEDGRMELDDLYVFPEFRNRGIGGAILKKYCAESAVPIFLYVFKRNTRAIALYERLGFRVVQEVGKTRLIMQRDAKILRTERLILRPWRESDAESLYAYAKDPDIGPIAGWPVHTSVENSREVIRTALSGEETYAVCLKSDGIAIGSIGLKFGDDTDMTERADECELGYWIGKPFWGQGLIPEAANELLRHAFEDLDMRAVWCGYYDGNEKSKRVQEKCGFVYHHTAEGLELSLLGEVRTGHTNLMTKEHWMQRRKL